MYSLFLALSGLCIEFARIKNDVIAKTSGWLPNVCLWHKAASGRYVLDLGVSVA